MLKNKKQIETIRNFQLPRFRQSREKQFSKVLYSQCDEFLGNWTSTKELSLVAGLPKKEVIGLELREEVEFGLNFPELDKENALVLGKLMQSGNITNKDIGIKNSNLDKHIFITGVTGNGKTTTVKIFLFNLIFPFWLLSLQKQNIEF